MAAAMIWEPSILIFATIDHLLIACRDSDHIAGGSLLRAIGENLESFLWSDGAGFLSDL
jgi:hypothetical protein